jgi:hypothetical protein
MTKEQLETLWSETDKNLYESYQRIRLQYREGTIKKKEYDQHKQFFDGFYFGWRDLYNKLLVESENIVTS